MDKATLHDLFDLASEAAREAGTLLFSRLRTDIEISKKGRVNLVTEMDLLAEQLIVGRIRQRYPDHAILAEERGGEGQSEIRWVIDPLDGTTNYAHGYRFFCVSIAVEVAGEVALGVVYDPVCDEFFSAIRGEGAWLNGARLSVSRTEQLVDGLVATGFSYREDQIRKNLVLFNQMILEARAVRRDGSAALDLCYVACGRFDGFWELSLNPWDVAAGSLIVTEAGGRVSLFNGSPASIYYPECLASNDRLHSQLSSILTRALSSEPVVRQRE